MPKKIIAAGYGRVSSMKQALEGTSAEDQKERISQYCADNDMELYKFYSDDGISGKTMEHRPGIRQLLDDAKDRRFDAVVFTKLDRVGRNARELHEFCHLVKEQYQLKLISIDMPALNGEVGAFGNLLFTILGGFAEFEREIIRERTSDGRHIRWSQAKYSKAVIGALPFGYRWDKKQKEIVEHPEQGPIVRRIFSMYLDEGYSIKQIAIKLTEDVIPTPSAAKFTKAKNKIAQRWSNMAVGKILKHEAYTGRPLQLNKFKRATAVSKNSGLPYIFATKERRDQSEWLEARYPAPDTGGALGISSEAA